MTTLSYQEVANIAEQVAKANGVNFRRVLTQPYYDPDGTQSIEIRYMLTPGSSDSIRGEPSARTVSEVIGELVDRGEQRSAFVRYIEEQGAA